MSTWWSLDSPLLCPDCVAMPFCLCGSAAGLRCEEAWSFSCLSCSDSLTFLHLEGDVFTWFYKILWLLLLWIKLLSPFSSSSYGPPMTQHLLALSPCTMHHNYLIHFLFFSFGSPCLLILSVCSSLCIVYWFSSSSLILSSLGSNMMFNWLYYSCGGNGS